jgi:type VI secretion system VasD/TssJ family lipoprotein
MKKSLVIHLVLFSCFVIVSCGSKPIPKTKMSELEIPEMDFFYEENAIQLHLKADPQLHLFEGSPHQLYLCIYQLSDPNYFNQLTGDQEGLYELLECGRFDASVATSRSLSIQPGENRQESFARAEGAKYVAVVAGYSTLQKEHMVRLFDIPILQKRKWLNPFSKYYKIGTLNVNLLLGPQEIQEFGGEK